MRQLLHHQSLFDHFVLGEFDLGQLVLGEDIATVGSEDGTPVRVRF
jgi:hypothetical protein